MKNKILNKKLTLSGSPRPVGTGWLSPLPDLRDYTTVHPEIKAFNKKLGLSAKQHALPEKVDLREWCSPIENQLNLGSCTAQSGVGIVEYFERRAYGKHIEASRLFLYKVTRNLMQVTGDTGAWLRDTMGALVLCGVPDEQYWPYKVADFDKEPSSFVYSLADNFETVKYFCHDPQGVNLPGADVLRSVKQYLDIGE